MKNKISINCHSSIKITGDKIIYFDPYNITETTNDANYVFITHDHYDHLDIESITKIINNETIIIIPNSCALDFLGKGIIKSSNIIGVDPNEQYTVNNLSFETIPSYNTNKEFHKKEYNWVGYIVELNNEKIYVAGDTDITEENKKVKCDIALIPIGGTYTMTKEEGAELINLIKPKTVIPTHYGSIVGKKEDGIAFENLINPEIECLILIK